MTWFESLKSFIEHIFHVDIRINSPEITVINTNGRDAINIDKNGKKITVNVGELEKEHKKEFEKIIKEYYEEEGEILSNKLQDYSDRFDEYDEHNGDKELLRFFEDKIPKDDHEVLKISLFMRSLFRSNVNISQIKLDIIRKFGERGNSIANLCTTEYFENFIKPLYEEIQNSEEDQETVSKTFGKIYELIVRNGLLAIFVNHNMSERDLDNEVEKKIQESKKYGFHQISDVLYIHALSRRNVETVERWMKRCTYEVNPIARRRGYITMAVSIDID